MMEDRRAWNEKNWEDIRNFISESREYRAADLVKQEFIASEVKKTNGRVTILEDWQKEKDILFS